MLAASRNVSREITKKLEIKPDKTKEFNNRMSPQGLRQLMKNVNDNQKQAIKENDFGSLLHLQVDTIPGRLAVWLVRNFDTCSYPCHLPMVG